MWSWSGQSSGCTFDQHNKSPLPKQVLKKWSGFGLTSQTGSGGLDVRVCVCVCVCERERERERQSVSISHSLISVHSS